jgi:ArsR family transcriptional regulator, arsenate/arsenite/antimonite-responsive transcriptional repressor
MKKINPVEFAKAISDETRQKIMGLCCCRELAVNEIVEQTNVSQPTVSHHLAILREAGLVDVRHDGKQTFYTLNQARVAFCCGQIMQVFAPETDETEAVKQAGTGNQSSAAA